MPDEREQMEGVGTMEIRGGALWTKCQTFEAPVKRVLK
jgi:hypothetical protein